MTTRPVESHRVTCRSCDHPAAHGLVLGRRVTRLRRHRDDAHRAPPTRARHHDQLVLGEGVIPLPIDQPDVLGTDDRARVLTVGQPASRDDQLGRRPDRRRRVVERDLGRLSTGRRITCPAVNARLCGREAVAAADDQGRDDRDDGACGWAPRTTCEVRHRNGDGRVPRVPLWSGRP